MPAPTESPESPPHDQPGDAPSIRGTRQRGALTALLMNLDAFHSAQDLHFELRVRGESVGLTTVYRALQQMTGDGLVDRVRTDTGELMYRWCARSLHHHLVCRRCGSAVEVGVAQIERWATQVAREHRFSDITPTTRSSGRAHVAQTCHSRGSSGQRAPRHACPKGDHALPFVADVDERRCTTGALHPGTAHLRG